MASSLLSAIPLSKQNLCVTYNDWFWDTELGKALNEFPTRHFYEPVEGLYSICDECSKTIRNHPEFPLRFHEDGKVRHACVRRDPDYKRDEHRSYQLAAKYITRDCTADVSSKGELCGGCVNAIAGLEFPDDFLKHFEIIGDGHWTVIDDSVYVYPFGKSKQWKRKEKPSDPSPEPEPHSLGNCSLGSANGEICRICAHYLSEEAEFLRS
jgi:hypothetical protein